MQKGTRNGLNNMKENYLDYKTLYLDAIPLTQPLEGNAGIDLPAYGDHSLVPNEIRTIGTGIAVSIPPGYCGLILGRSGNAFRRDFYVRHIGLIDSNYRGEIFVRVENKHFTDAQIPHGTLFAQLLIIPVPTRVLNQVDNLDVTERGEKGLGSSGVLANIFLTNNGSI